MAIQANGKIVAVGVIQTGSGNDFALARYNPNGSLDTTFSGDGKQTSDFGDDDHATGVALQADGKVIAVGLARGVSADFALARYNTNGSLDTSFSGDGKQTTDFGGYFDSANAVALQGDGKIVAAGLAGPFGAGDFALARYNPTGTLDPSFSEDGKQTTDFLFGGTDAANGVVLQGNGKVVAAGFASGWTTGGDFALARYDSNGSLDTSFSSDGKVRSSFGGSDGASGVALQANGRILAVGSGRDYPRDFALARYLGG